MPERRVRRQRLRIEHVEHCGQLAALQLSAQRLVIDEMRPAVVDEAGASLHSIEHSRVDQVMRILRVRRGDQNEVRLWQHSRKILRTEHLIDVTMGFPGSPNAEHTQAELLGEFRRVPAHRANADDQERLARNARTVKLLPQGLLLIGDDFREAGY